MSLVINSYQTGRPSKADEATAIEHLQILSTSPADVDRATGERQPSPKLSLTHDKGATRLEHGRLWRPQSTGDWDCGLSSVFGDTPHGQRHRFVTLAVTVQHARA